MPKKPLFIIGLENRLNNPTFPLAAARVRASTQTTFSESRESLLLISKGRITCSCLARKIHANTAGPQSLGSRLECPDAVRRDARRSTLSRFLMGTGRFPLAMEPSSRTNAHVRHPIGANIPRRGHGRFSQIRVLGLFGRKRAVSFEPDPNRVLWPASPVCAWDSGRQERASTSAWPLWG